MTKRDRLLLMTVAPAVLVVAFWFHLLSPKLSDLSSARDSVAAARTELDTAQAKVAVQKADQQKLEQERHSLATAARAVPTSISVGTPPLLRQLQTVARTSGISLSAITPAAADPSAPTAASTDVDAGTLSVTFSGSYENTQRFLRQLRALVKVSGSRVDATGRLLAISAVQLAPDSGSQKLSGSFEATMYALKSQASIAAAAAAAAAATTPTTTTGGSTAAPTTPATVTP